MVRRLGMVLRVLFYGLLPLFALTGCCGGRSLRQEGRSESLVMEASPHPVAREPRMLGGSADQVAAPPLVIYRTAVPLESYVPINLSPGDGSRVESYPAPSDLSDAQRPLALTGGYWLDRRGVTLHSAFTDITYAEYVTRKGVTPDFLLSHVKHRAPFTAFYVCPVQAGQASRAEQAQRYVDQGFSGCQSLRGGDE